MELSMEFVDPKTNQPCTPEQPVVTREQWGAAPPIRQLMKQRRPAKFIRMTHMPGHRPCRRSTDCERDVRLKQEFDMRNLGWSDVQANFLIGDDKRIYEGRGWLYQVDRLAKYSAYHGKMYEILYLGEFGPGGKPPAAYIDSFRRIVNVGVKKNYVYKNFQIISDD